VPQDHRRWHGWLQLLRSDQAPAETLVAEHPDGVVGFINVAPSEDTDTDPALVGQVSAIYEAGGWQADGSSRTNDSRGSPLVKVRYRHRQAAAAT
jgi:hypothetical protein